MVRDSKRFVTLQVDMTKDTPPIAERFKIVAPPAIVFLDANGKPRSDLHLINKELPTYQKQFPETLKKIS